MAIYFIRNKLDNKWCDSNSYTTDSVEEARMRYWSEKAAKKAIKSMVDNHTRLNKYWEANPTNKYVGWEPYSTEYEVVAFKLVEVGVV